MAGFTLLELLIAMVIGGGLVYLTSEVLVLVQRGVERSRQVADRAVIEQRAIAVVKAALSNLVPPVAAEDRYRIVATESVFEFAAVAADSRAHRGTLPARILVEASADGRFAIVFEQWGQESRASSASPEFRLVLFKDLAGASLHYLYRAPSGLRADPAWPGQHPELVTLRWARADSAGHAGSLSVRTRLDAGANCRLELQSLSCR